MVICSRSKMMSHQQLPLLPSRLPQLVVFDLDMCMWSPEMYELSGPPKTPVYGASSGLVVGASNGKETVRLFEGARIALNELRTRPELSTVRVAAASSTEEPEFAKFVLNTIELSPGVLMEHVFSFLAIGRRSGGLTSDKRTHFKKISEISGIPYSEMLFFDDCNWGDHVGKLHQQLGVVGVRTPSGLQENEWRDGLKLFSTTRAP
eukprot:GSMAST32.ASY1.ANO1.1613.1 assembled CDS